MVGGNYRCARSRGRDAWLAVLSVVATAAFVTVSRVDAHVVASDAEPHSDCATQTSNEKSIVVAQNNKGASEKNANQQSDQSKTHEDSPSLVIATDREDDAQESVALEPIASAADYEPDLAVPDLAEAVVEVSDCHSAITRVADASVLPTHAGPKRVVAPMSPSNNSAVAGFNGVQPGTSTRSEVLEKWGMPESGPTDASMLQYQFDELYSVQVHFNDVPQHENQAGPVDQIGTNHQVSMIRIALAQPRDAQSLIKQLHLDDLRAAIFRKNDGDAQAEPIALLFPEQGIELSYLPVDMAMVSDAMASDESPASDKPLVHEITIRPIKAAPFVLRAENDLLGPLTTNIQDLQRALELDSSSARAHWLLSKIRLSVGGAIEAERLAARAVELVPGEDRYRLHLAKCLQQLARYDAAVVETRQVLEGSTATPIVRARALHQMGLLASLGSKNIAQRAVALHLKAIDLADQLVGDDVRSVSPSEGQVAKRLLLDAHLAIAVDIAKGKWQQKDEYVPQWLARASALAEEMIASGEIDLQARLQVAVSALRAVSNLDPPIDPELWVQEAEETAAELQAATTDSLVQQQIDWELGIAYFQAAQIEHRRGKPHKSLRYGEQAEEKLVPIAESRLDLPDTGHLLGRLYFQLGAIYAVHLEDHVQACQWYDLAAELLLEQVPVTSVAVPGRHGDALVSMGVSYWYADSRQKALKLTQAGADLMEEAVASGLLPADVLAVPYGNLASMYGAQGEKEPASRYAKLASKHAEVESSGKRR